MKSPRLVSVVGRAFRGWGELRAGRRVVVALSGGADSVALLDCMAQLAREEGAFEVVAAHLDHGLRPEAPADATFCGELCQSLGVPIEFGQGDVSARAQRDGEGIEAAARAERYAFLHRVQAARGAHAIALAHTGDDQAETLLLRLVRGSGRTGLAAMRARSGDLRRPLLQVGRQEILHHLAVRGLIWREDPSNRDDRYGRNRVRHELLPYLETRFNPAIREGLARTAALLADEEDLIESAVAAWLGRAAARDENDWILDRHALNAAPPALARRAVRCMLERTGGGAGIAALHVERVLGLAAAERSSGRRLALPGGREARISFGDVRIGARRPVAEMFAVPLVVPGQAQLPGGHAVLAQSDRGPVRQGSRMAVVARPEGSLIVRTRLAGDRVWAKGREMSLKRFLMERRVPADERVGLPLVAVGRQVVWVPGQPAQPPPCTARRFVRLEYRTGSATTWRVRP